MRRNVTSPLGIGNHLFARVSNNYGASGNPSELEDQPDIERSDRYTQNEHNLIVMNCKRKICEILLRLLDIENDMQVSTFLSLLKQSEKRKGRAEAESP